MNRFVVVAGLGRNQNIATTGLPNGSRALFVNEETCGRSVVWRGPETSRDRPQREWENHQAMFALFGAHYNFCRKRSLLKMTPAVAAGLAREPWTLKKLLAESAKALCA